MLELPPEKPPLVHVPFSQVCPETQPGEQLPPHPSLPHCFPAQLGVHEVEVVHIPLV